MSYEVSIVPGCTSARLTAWLIDCCATYMLVVGGMMWLGGTVDIREFIAQTTYVQLGILLTLTLGVHLVVMGISGRTIGMWPTELQFIQAEGDPVEWGNILRRPLGVLLLPLSVALLGLVPLLNEHRRTLGDYVSGTRVVESITPGSKIGFDTWRVFKGLLRPLAPVTLALTIGALLLTKSRDLPNKVIFLDAVTVALIGTLLIATVITAVKVKLTRVRVEKRGIFRSGLLGWSKRPIEWQEIDHARVIPGRMFSYFEVQKKNRRKFRVPLELHVAQLMANEFARHHIRLEP